MSKLVMMYVCRTLLLLSMRVEGAGRGRGNHNQKVLSIAIIESVITCGITQWDQTNYNDGTQIVHVIFFNRLPNTLSFFCHPERLRVGERVFQFLRGIFLTPFWNLPMMHSTFWIIRNQKKVSSSFKLLRKIYMWIWKIKTWIFILLIILLYNLKLVVHRVSFEKKKKKNSHWYAFHITKLLNCGFISNVRRKLVFAILENGEKSFYPKTESPCCYWLLVYVFYHKIYTVWR